MIWGLSNLNDSIWEQFLQMHDAQREEGIRRQEAVPARESIKRPEHGIWVVKTPDLVAGLCLYPTAGDWVMVEHVATDPKASPADRNQALNFMVSALRGYGAMTGKVPVCFPTHDSIANRLYQAGWYNSNARVLVTAPWLTLDIQEDVAKNEAPAHPGGGEPGLQGGKDITPTAKVRQSKRAVKPSSPPAVEDDFFGEGDLETRESEPWNQ